MAPAAALCPPPTPPHAAAAAPISSPRLTAFAAPPLAVSGARRAENFIMDSSSAFVHSTTILPEFLGAPAMMDDMVPDIVSCTTSWALTVMYGLSGIADMRHLSFVSMLIQFLILPL